MLTTAFACSKSVTSGNAIASKGLSAEQQTNNSDKKDAQLRVNKSEPNGVLTNENNGLDKAVPPQTEQTDDIFTLPEVLLTPEFTEPNKEIEEKKKKKKKG